MSELKQGSRLLNDLIELRENMSKSTTCACLQRECCDLLPVCHTQHLGAGLAQGPRAVSDHRTNQYILLQMYFISWAGIIIGKQEVCKELFSPEKLHSMQTDEFLENPKSAEAGRDLQVCPVQASLIAGPAGAGHLGPRPSAVTRHAACGWGNEPCQAGGSGEAVPAHSSCCRWRQPLLSHFPLCAESKAGGWGWRKGSCRCMGREAGCCCCPALLHLLTTPASLASPQPHFCAVMKSSHVSPQHQLAPECTATEPPPAALQPWAAPTAGTHHSPTRDCGCPTAPSESHQPQGNLTYRENTKTISSATRLGVKVSFHSAYKIFACSWLFSHHF